MRGCRAIADAAQVIILGDRSLSYSLHPALVLGLNQGYIESLSVKPK
jgi:hypothetical protein